MIRENVDFLALRNRQALLGMHYINVLNIIKINIHAIGAEQTNNSIIVVQISALYKEMTQSRKQSKLKSTARTQTAF